MQWKIVSLRERERERENHNRNINKACIEKMHERKNRRPLSIYLHPEIEECWLQFMGGSLKQ